jgi:uncharacterized protein YndB with AHSA1/START domain
MYLPLVIMATMVGVPAVAIASKSTPAPRSTIAPVPDKVIHVSTTLTVSPFRAYSYFVDRALLQSWLTAAADVDARVGGKYELFWQPDDRENNSTIGCRLTALAVGQLIAFQWRSPKQFKSFANSADPLTHVVVSFVPEGSGTRVHLIHSGWRSGAEWDAARVWQERAWNTAFEVLGRIAKK